MGWMLLSVGLGGALGAISRYAASLLVTSMASQSGWLAIIAVNVAGSFGMGLMTAAVAVSTFVSEPMRGFIMVGFLGALTTFSSFSFDAFSFFTRGDFLAGGLYLVGSVCLSLAGFYAGFLLLRLFMGQG